MNLILGLDPGSIITGYGIIEIQYNQFHYLQSGVIKYPIIGYVYRLTIMCVFLNKLIKFYDPNCIVIEKIFVDKNFNTALQLGQTIGIIISSILYTHIVPIIVEYSNLKTKLIIKNLHFNKININIEIKKLFNISIFIEIDESDAIAVALTHCFYSKICVYNQICVNFSLVILNIFIILFIIIMLLFYETDQNYMYNRPIKLF